MALKIIKTISILSLLVLFLWQNLSYSHPEAIGDLGANAKKEIEVSAVEDLMREHGHFAVSFLSMKSFTGVLVKTKKLKTISFLKLPALSVILLKIIMKSWKNSMFFLNSKKTASFLVPLIL